MAPNIYMARKQLSYPLYCADFDPSNPDFLLVGGGGGSTSSGVPNKITLLDVSRRDTPSEITDIDLPKNEDSVTSLGIAESSDDALTVYAGINSSVKDQEAGKNEHFRSFRVGLPAKKRKADEGEKTEKSTASSVAGTAKTQSLTRAALFKSASGPKSEAYQRVLRVAPASPKGGERLAAIASGLAAKNEVLVFRATSSPGLSNVVSRIEIESGEAVDLDIIPDNDGNAHMLSYCTDYDVYLQYLPTSSNTDIEEPVKVFTYPEVRGKRSKIRGLRWLNDRYILLLCNRPQGGGAELLILKTAIDYSQCLQILTKTLAKTTKQAVGLATATMSASPKGYQQFIAAVAGQDSSVEILSINWLPDLGMDRFTQHDHLYNVHSGPITRITFSTFKSPPFPVSKDTKPQYIRLATVGVDLNVMVQTIPLRPVPPLSKEPRYVLTAPPETKQNAINIFIALVVVSIVAFCMQVFCELRGVVPPTLNAQTWFSPEWQSRLSVTPYHKYSHVNAAPGPVIPESLPPVLSSALSATAETASAVAEAGATLLHNLVSEQKLNPDSQIVIRDSGDAAEAEMHHSDSDAVKKDETIKKWDQLSEKEKKGWKKRLIDAGHWTEKQGETVLKGILFSELGAAVGAAVRGG